MKYFKLLQKRYHLIGNGGVCVRNVTINIGMDDCYLDNAGSLNGLGLISMPPVSARGGRVRFDGKRIHLASANSLLQCLSM